MSKGFFQLISQEFAAATAQPNANVQEMKDLATKFNVPFNASGIEAGCPGTMNPLSETPTVLFAWVNEAFYNNSQRTDKTDKAIRFVETLNALKAIDLFATNANSVEAKKAFLELGVSGRAVFVYIANKQNDEMSAKILKTIVPYASEGLFMEDKSYFKVQVTNSQVFDKYIKPAIEPYINIEETRTESSSLSDNQLNIKSEAKKEEDNKEDKSKTVDNSEKIIITKIDFELLGKAANGADVSKSIKNAVSDFAKCIVGNPIENSLNRNELDPLHKSLFDLINNDTIPDDPANYHAMLVALSEDYPS